MWTNLLIWILIIILIIAIILGIGWFIHTIEKNYPEPKTPERETHSIYEETLKDLSDCGK